ncbi:heavy-metal-associated domain-containing protein [Flavobacterium sp. UBA7682]|uniref:heavy-metal-associated domain-containing protein n=1 Tax=Flavobacterium sp. UBA7682 TaxID=1946560 RepID=UPI0025BF1DC8|nr:metal transporter [Flavobacterium sp. UBA7682]
MKNIVLGMMLLFVGFTTQAQDTRGGAELSGAKKSKNAKYDIEVNGNCEMCKKRIEKAAFSVSGVKSAEWHIDDHTLHLIINEEKCSLMDVKKAIAKVGHDTDEVKATEEDYQKLHGCCLYERK